MTTDIELTSPPKTVGPSTVWDIYIPMVIVAAPPAIFKLIGLLTVGLDQPGAIARMPVLVAMGVLEVFGIIAMAVLILMRSEIAFAQLSLFTKGQPSAWRRLALGLSIASLLLCDIVTNVWAAFSGAGFLLIVAVPLFLTYIGCKRLAFVNLTEYQQEIDNLHSTGTKDQGRSNYQ